jgi:hypothetical protein
VDFSGRKKAAAAVELTSLFFGNGAKNSWCFSEKIIYG